MTDHPITPPPELIQEWWEGDNGALDEFDEVVKQAAQWGANQELEACCEWVSQWCCMVGDSRPEVGLRAARRPKSKSLAQEALAVLDDTCDRRDRLDAAHENIIRRALERLQELEGQADG